MSFSSCPKCGESVYKNHHPVCQADTIERLTREVAEARDVNEWGPCPKHTIHESRAGCYACEVGRVNVLIHTNCRNHSVNEELRDENARLTRENAHLLQEMGRQSGEHFAKVDVFEAELAAARRERDEAMRDAERYRYVRAKPHMLLHLSNKEFDAAIDAARGEQEKQDD